MSDSGRDGELRLLRERLAAFEDIGLALVGARDLDELLMLVVDRVSRVMRADRSTLYLVDEATDEIWSKVAQGDLVREIRLKRGDGMAGWVAKSGEALLLADAYDDPRFDPKWDKLTGYRTKSVLCVPLSAQDDRVIGVLQVLNHEGEGFEKSDLQRLEAIAAQATVAVANVMLFSQLREQNAALSNAQRELEARIVEQNALLEIARSAAESATLSEVLQTALAETSRAMGARAGVVLMAEGEPFSALSPVSTSGRLGEPADVLALSKFAPLGAFDEQHAYVDDGALTAPMIWDGGFGALRFLSTSPFDDDHLKLATLVAGQLSTAIGLKSASERREQSERMSAIGQLLSSVLHDLKTPMTVISGYAQLLAHEQEPAQRAKHLETIVRQVEHVSAMTKETLAFARGERQLWIRKVYLQRFFEDLGEQLTRDIQGRVASPGRSQPPGTTSPIAFSVEVLDRGIGRFDEHKVQRAVHNLVRNAVEACDGRVGGAVRLVVLRSADDVVIEVWDNGPGVAPETRDRLFREFGSFGKRGGTGLGLAMVARVAEAHSGSVELESAPGRTCFRLRLPQVRATVAGSEFPPSGLTLLPS